MKTSWYYLFIVPFFVAGCTAVKEKEQVVAEPAGAKTDLRAAGLQDLKGSGSMKDIICQNWDYKEDAAYAGMKNSSDKVEIAFRGYSFFKDGIIIKNPRGDFRTGKWELKENIKPISITISFDDGDTESKKIAFLEPHRMTLVDFIGKEKNMIELSSEAFNHIRLQDDPFYISNMLWRKKPAKPETGEAIKKRLKDCIHFFVLFYDQRISAPSDIVHFTGLPSCFKWYAGGIYLQQKKELPENWSNCFYDQEQAMKAYKLADKLLSHKYTWPKGERNWLKQNVFVLKQMEQRVDSL